MFYTHARRSVPFGEKQCFPTAPARPSAGRGAPPLNQARTEWQPGPASPKLGENEVHVWRATLEQPPGVRARMQALLSADERQRLKKMLRQETQDQYLVMRGMLRSLLGACLGCAPDAIAFSYNEQKKPALAAPHTPDIRFNISHSGNLGLCAFTLGRSIGVDLEHNAKERATEAIAKRFFSAAESRALAKLPEAARFRAFYRCWTSKEAYVKARGDGLTFPLDEFDVAVAPAGTRKLLRVKDHPEAPRQWRLKSIHAGNAYTATCAIQNQNPIWKFWDWQP